MAKIIELGVIIIIPNFCININRDTLDSLLTIHKIVSNYWY